MSTYNVVEAAIESSAVRKVVVASSETTYGVCFAEGDKDFHSFPLEEDYDIDPMDSYGLSKVCNEKDGGAPFAMRYGGRHLRACASGKRHRGRTNTRCSRSSRPIRCCASANAWKLYRRARPRRDRPSLPGEGRARLSRRSKRHQRHDHSRNARTQEFLSKNFPHVPITRPLEGFEAPLSNRKGARSAGFKESATIGANTSS